MAMPCRGFECDLNDVDVSEVQDFTGVFTVSFNRQFNGDISQWDTSSATCMKRMFEKTQEKSRMAETSMWFKSHWSPWMALASRIKALVPKCNRNR